MADDTPPQMKPQDTTNFLLGGMQKQLEAIALEQATARGAGEAFRNEIRGDIGTINTRLEKTASDVEVLKAKQTPKTPWYSIAAGFSGIIGAIVAGIALLKVINP